LLFPAILQEKNKGKKKPVPYDSSHEVLAEKNIIVLFYTIVLLL
jgi:hypothetical protein